MLISPFTELARLGRGVRESIEAISGLGAHRLVVIIVPSSTLGLTFDRDDKSNLVVGGIVDSGGGSKEAAVRSQQDQDQGVRKASSGILCPRPPQIHPPPTPSE